jgi:hypothetical protein
MSTVWVTTVVYPELTGVAVILTHGPAASGLVTDGAHVGRLDPAGAGGGAVYTAVARPSGPVVIVRAESVP